ncbi:zinc finger protein 277 isoform X5 [Chelonia mydas]|uniref:zinc finger protein 277 isoform X5 n=1 Tax=Chelonia mydas TaxID=8469 RepID=UPI001CA9DBFE|nr:zinc finger protein 277 isoform X5 [Chelonia mydas]
MRSNQGCCHFGTLLSFALTGMPIQDYICYKAVVHQYVLQKNPAFGGYPLRRDPLYLVSDQRPRLYKGETKLFMSMLVLSQGSYECVITGKHSWWGLRTSRARAIVGVGLISDSECILEPLSLPESPCGVAAVEESPSVPCIFCEEYFPQAEQDQLLKHMIIEHKLVIADVKLVADFRRYILYWKKRFTEQPITDFCSVIRTNSEAPVEEQDNYFLLCDVLPEDRLLREQLQQKRLEFGKSWEEVQSEDDRELLDNLEEDWSDWEEHPVCAVCLFCEKQADTTKKLCFHMKEAHGFDLLKIKAEHGCCFLPLPGLKFYQQVKLVNFIRREIHQCRCYNCKEMFQSKTELISHVEVTKHITFLPTRSTWDQPQYYFPTYENDTLLCTLSDSEDELTAKDQSEDVPIISEDISDLEALRQSSVLNQLLREENNN